MARGIKKFLISSLLVIFLAAAVKGNCLAQTNASQIEGAQELLEKEKILRERLGSPEKFYVKNIIIQGTNAFSQEEVAFLVSPFKEHWLTKQDIERLLNTIKQAYQDKGAGQAADISYEIKKQELIITIESPWLKP